MAALQSLQTEADDCAHYYHCVLYDVPQEMPLSEVAAQVVPQESSSPVSTLLQHHCKIVPHRLHMYKEPLDHKFGFITYFIHVGPKCTLEHSVIHQHVLEWIRGDLQLHMAHVHTKVCLAQPPECYSCQAFSRSFTNLCDMVNPTKVMDSKKMETFILSKVTFDEGGKNAGANDTTPQQSGTTDSAATEEDPHQDRTTEPFTWKTVGSFSVSQLTSKELVWLKKQANDFPPLLITNNDFASAHCAPEALHKFFESALSPLFTVKSS